MRTSALWLLAFAACQSAPSVPATKQAPSSAAQQWLDAVGALCGQAFAGKVTANTPPQPDDPFTGKALLMHVRACSDAELRIPFAVGDDRSRTWIVRRVGAGLSLAHDHRHRDGTSDAVTLYGGETATPGTPNRQAFPVNKSSIDMFRIAGLTASVQNTWALEVWPHERFVYELSRPSGRLFRVEFDLTKPVAAPPPPWAEAPLP